MTRWIEALHPRTRGWSGSRIFLNVLGVLGAAGLLFSRDPGHLLHPELWAEDGVVWLQGAYNVGWRCLLIPCAGYLQTLSNLGGLLVAGLPLTQAPLIFALIAFVIQLTPVVLLLSPRGAVLLPSRTARLLLVLYDVGMPNSSEVYVNLTNAMWHLAIVAFLLVVLPKPRSIAGLVVDVIVLVLGGLSGPLVLFIAPIAWWQVAALRQQGDGGKRVLYAVTLSLCAVVQGALVIAQSAENRIGHLGASFDRLVHILANQVILGGVIGAHDVRRLLTWHLWLHSWPAALCCAGAAVLGVAAFVRGPAVYRQFAVLAVLIMASGLKSPMVSISAQWMAMQHPEIGDRYYIFPMLAWFMTLLVLAAERSRFGLNWVARGVMLCCVVGIVTDWRHVPYAHTGYYEAAKKFDRAAPGTTVVFSENPISWKFTLTKH
jgi:hypothetical protein